MLFRRLAQVSWLLPLIGAALAQQAAGQADHPLFGGFPESEISEYETLEARNHLVALGSLQSIRGQVTPEASERVRGRLTRILYAVAPGFSGQDVHDYFQEQMRERGYRELFRCTGRACGSSEHWANDIFGKRILYGPVRNQYYLAMGSEPPGGLYISVYVITRGNRQLLAFLEIVEPEDAAPAANVNQSGIEAENRLRMLREFGAIAAPELRFGPDDQPAADADLTEIVELLRLAPELRLYIVAHLAEGGLAESLARSEARAQSARQALIERGIDGARLEARGVGPLAPLCAGGGCRDRTELVLRP